jgi:hypothetical protein
MDYASRKRMRSRLDWLYQARDGAIRALGPDTIHDKILIQPTVDPIRIMVYLQLLHPLQGEIRQAFRDYFRAWAKEGDCEITNIDINDTYIKMQVLTKYRHARRDVHGRFTGGKE